MRVSVKYFASIRETIGLSGESLDTTAVTLAALRDELIACGGGHSESLARGRAVRMALNQVMCDEASALQDGAEVAFFPPVTGG
jgi:sulfur-carrier protein